jgi:hypothetical protein
MKQSYQDRIGFFSSISVNPDENDQEYQKCAIKFFDELMGLYDTLKHYDCHISATDTGNRVLLCTVEMESAADAESLYNYLIQLHVLEIYGKRFEVHTTKSADNATIVSIVMRTIAEIMY